MHAGMSLLLFAWCGAVPDACPPPRVSDITKNSCRLEWDEAEENGGPITGYQIFYAGNFYKIGRGERSFVCKNLMSDRVYRFCVACCNMHGWGPASGLSEPVRTFSDVPDAPTALYVPVAGITSMQVQWQAPRECWGARIIGYRVMWRVEGAEEDYGANECVEEFTMAQLELRQYHPRAEEEGGDDVRSHTHTHTHSHTHTHTHTCGCVAPTHMLCARRALVGVECFNA